MIKNRIETKEKKSKKNNDDNGTPDGASVILGIFIASIILGGVLASAGAFDNPYTELGLDRNDIAYDYVIEQYPEYVGCEVTYYMDSERVAIKCKIKDDEDKELRLKGEGNIERTTLYFEEKTLDEWFVEKYKSRNSIDACYEFKANPLFTLEG